MRALVTGGTGGIGRATVDALLRRGAFVAVGARSDARIREVFGDNLPEGIVAAAGDLSNPEQARQTVLAAIDTLGGLDVLVTAAGVYAEQAVESVDVAHWDRMIAGNLTSTFFAIQAALPELRASRGCIVTVASESGMVGLPFSSAYCAAKGAVVNLTRALALELAPEVRVNCVCPGNVDTAMIQAAAADTGDPDRYLALARSHAPLGRMARAEEIAALIDFLSSDGAGFMTGAIVAVDGGQTAGPKSFG
jgi:NAD(P)-dependent dehydrogenase (short-subunit alcohol dehydrogenase family)